MRAKQRAKFAARLNAQYFGPIAPAKAEAISRLAEYAHASKLEYWDQQHAIEARIRDRSEAAEAERARRVAMVAPGSHLHSEWTRLERACANGRPIGMPGIDDPFQSIWPTSAGCWRPRTDTRHGG